MDRSVAPPIHLGTARLGPASDRWAECAHASCGYSLYVCVCVCMCICVYDICTYIMFVGVGMCVSYSLAPRPALFSVARTKEH